MLEGRFVHSFLLIVLLSNLAQTENVVVQGSGLSLALDRSTGLPNEINSTHGKGRTWLIEPASLEVTNVVTGVTAAPTTLHRTDATFTGPLPSLKLSLSHQWTLCDKGLSWHLNFEGTARRVEHRVTIDLPVLKRSDRVFTPTLRGVVDVGMYPTHTPTEYGHYDWQGAEGNVLPLVSVLDPLADCALTVALPACDNIPHFQVEWKDGHTLRLTLARRGMGGGKPSELNLLFLTHAADYRAAIEAYSDLFPRYFNPALPRGPYEGTFYYHHIQDHPDYEEMARQNVRYLWSSFWFTHLGEYLPDARQWHPYTYAKWWNLGETMSDEKINAFIREMHEHGIGTYAYFNVTEYGGRGGKEGNAEEAEQRLREDFADALMKTAEGESISTWEGSMAMNPGAGYSLRPFLREQVRRHIERIPQFEGFVIDRLDWASKLDYGHSDGLTMIGDRAVENMAVPVADAVQDVCRMSHAAGKRVFVNQFWRVEVLRDADGVCHESDPLPLLGYLAPLRPASAWHHRAPYDGDLLRFEAQLKRRLHWALFPQMIAHEFPISQQPANPRAADMLEIYAPLFEPLLGKRQILTPHCVSVDGANRVNLFVNGAGHLVVSVTSHLQFLSGRSDRVRPATVTIKTKAAKDLQWAHVYSADGPPYRASISTDRGKVSVLLGQHNTASVLVAGTGPEPTLRNDGTARIEQKRELLFPLNEPVVETPKDVPTPSDITHYLLNIEGEHVGLPEKMQVFADDKLLGTLKGTQGSYRLSSDEDRPARVELYAGHEGVWFVPRSLELIAVCAGEQAYRVASWSPGDSSGFVPTFTGRIWMEMSPCDPQVWTPPACEYVGRAAKIGGQWKSHLGANAVWIANVKDTVRQNGYELQIGGQSYTWDVNVPDDARVLQALRDEPGPRPATCWYADDALEVTFTTPTDRPCRLTLYVLDYDRNGRECDVTSGQGQRVSVSADETSQGVYLTWRVQGTAKLKLQKRQGANVVLSGVFVDPAVSQEETGPAKEPPRN